MCVVHARQKSWTSSHHQLLPLLRKPQNCYAQKLLLGRAQQRNSPCEVTVSICCQPNALNTGVLPKEVLHPTTLCWDKCYASLISFLYAHIGM